MIEINLLPQEYRKKSASKFTLPEIPIKRTLQAVFIVLFSVQILASIFAVYQNTELKFVKTDIEKLSATNTAITKQKAEMKKNNERIIKMNSLMETKFLWSQLLANLVNTTTKGVWFKNLSIDAVSQGSGTSKSKETKSRILKLAGSVVGSGEETAIIGKMIADLKANNFFNEVFLDSELSNLIQTKIRDFDVYDFSLYCYFKPGMVPSDEKK